MGKLRLAPVGNDGPVHSDFAPPGLRPSGCGNLRDYHMAPDQAFQPAVHNPQAYYYYHVCYERTGSRGCR